MTGIALSTYSAVLDNRQRRGGGMLLPFNFTGRRAAINNIIINVGTPMQSSSHGTGIHPLLLGLPIGGLHISEASPTYLSRELFDCMYNISDKGQLLTRIHAQNVECIINVEPYRKVISFCRDCLKSSKTACFHPFNYISGIL